MPFEMGGPKRTVARKVGRRMLGVCAVLAAIALPGAPGAQAYAAAGRTVAFSGHYSGTVALLIDNGSVTISSVRGTGTGTLVGASSVLGSGTATSSSQCNDPFTGTGTITGPKAKIDLTVVQSKSTGCSSGTSGPVTVTFNGVAKVTGGSGAAAGASGSLKFHGSTKLGGTSGSQDGPYTVTLTGKLTVK